MKKKGNFIDNIKKFNEKFPDAFDWALWFENDETKLAEPQLLYELHGLELQLTCGACPEQYDVYSKSTKKQVGYLRLRHGSFRVDFPDCGDETIYRAEPNGEGVFYDNERFYYLSKALEAILKKIGK